MESGNSSSMQSSSGGDDQEYESSGGVLGGSSTSYFSASNVNTTTQVSQYNNSNPMFMLSSAQQLQLLPPTPQTSYLDVFQNQSNYQNLMFWQQQQFGGSGSGSGGGSGSGSVGGGGVGLSDHPSVNNPSCTVNPSPLSAHSNSPRPSTSQHTGANASAGTGASAGAGAGASGSGGSTKNPRKRTRASRRAPTTVLTTDTSNFRAMVQEFTGIPSSPFSAAASPLLSRRLTDLLSGTSTSSPGPSLRPGPPPPMVGPSSTSLERLFAGYNSYPLRPSAHKISSPTTDNTPQNLQPASNTNTFSPLGNLSIQSLLQPTTAPSSLRYPPSVPSATGLLNPSLGNFQDLSGVIGSDPMFGFAPMRLAPDSGDWRGGSSGVGGVASNEESGDHGEENIGTDINNNDNNNNNNDNQQMEGSISGGGTSNYNVNMNCARDKGLDSSTSNRGGAQGTLGDFLG